MAEDDRSDDEHRSTFRAIAHKVNSAGRKVSGKASSARRKITGTDLSDLVSDYTETTTQVLLGISQDQESANRRIAAIEKDTAELRKSLKSGDILGSTTAAPDDAQQRTAIRISIASLGVATAALVIAVWSTI